MLKELQKRAQRAPCSSQYAYILYKPKIVVFQDTPIEQFELLMKVNYFGAIFCTKAVLPGMKKRKRGTFNKNSPF